MAQFGFMEFGQGEFGGPKIVSATVTFGADGQHSVTWTCPQAGSFEADGQHGVSWSSANTNVGTQGNARLTQDAVETLVGPANPNARLTQDAVEVLVQVGPYFEADGQHSVSWVGTNLALGTFEADGSHAVSWRPAISTSWAVDGQQQVAWTYTTPTNARLTQDAVEALIGPGNPNARLTQVAVETLVRIQARRRPQVFVVT